MSYYSTGRRHYTKKHKSDKADAQYGHAKKRARERYGIHLSRSLYDAWVESIQGKRPDIRRRCLGKETNTLTHFAIEWGNREIPVVYDKSRQTITTVLPPSGLSGPVKTTDEG